MDFKVWKTIKIGTGLKTADDFRGAFCIQRYRISDWAKDFLDQPTFTVSNTESEINLVNVSVAELGFTEEAMLRGIYARAKEMGLGICPAEVGPQLRLQYDDQPMDEFLSVGMEPIADSDRVLGVFRVGRVGDGLWLYACSGHPVSLWRPDRRWVFVLSKSVTRPLGTSTTSNLDTKSTTKQPPLQPVWNFMEENGFTEAILKRGDGTNITFNL